MSLLGLMKLDEADKDIFNQITVLVKDRKIRIEGVNVGRQKPGKIIATVNEALGDDVLNHPRHRYIYTVFSIRPPRGAEDPFDTNTDYCHYDETHADYVYYENWSNFLIHLLQPGNLAIERIKKKFDAGEKLNIEDYKP